MKYGNEIQFIPDRDRGDGGLEAYLFDGTAYQCYAAEDAYSTSDLTDAQKSKIRNDIAKLSKNEKQTKALLGTILLIRWVLLTPYFDSKTLVEYARMKSDRVRAEPRPFWCHSEFEIVVSTDDMFAYEKTKLFDQVNKKLYLDIPHPTDDDLFAAASGGVADILSKKLIQVPSLEADAGRLNAYKSSVLIDYVRGRQQMEKLANDYPLINLAVERRFTSTLIGLSRELAGTPGGGTVVVETLMRRLASALQGDAPALSPLLCEELARYAIAQWLVDCPLFFPVAA
jgi:hypothetical protein